MGEINFKKIWNHPVYIFTGLIVAIIFFFVISRNIKGCDEAYLEFYDLSFNGLVLKKYIDHSNHALKTIDLKYSNDITWSIVYFNFDYSGLYEYIQEYDSIVKRENSYRVTVYRGDNTIEFDVDYQCQ